MNKKLMATLVFTLMLVLAGTRCVYASNDEVPLDKSITIANIVNYDNKPDVCNIDVLKVSTAVLTLENTSEYDIKITSVSLKSGVATASYDKSQSNLSADGCCVVTFKLNLLKNRWYDKTFDDYIIVSYEDDDGEVNEISFPIKATIVGLASYIPFSYGLDAKAVKPEETTNDAVNNVLHECEDACIKELVQMQYKTYVEYGETCNAKIKEIQESNLSYSDMPSIDPVPPPPVDYLLITPDAYKTVDSIQKGCEDACIQELIQLRYKLRKEYRESCNAKIKDMLEKKEL